MEGFWSCERAFRKDRRGDPSLKHGISVRVVPRSNQARVPVMVVVAAWPHPRIPVPSLELPSLAVRQMQPVQLRYLIPACHTNGFESHHECIVSIVSQPWFPVTP